MEWKYGIGQRVENIRTNKRGTVLYCLSTDNGKHPAYEVEHNGKRTKWSEQYMKLEGGDMEIKHVEEFHTGKSYKCVFSGSRFFKKGSIYTCLDGDNKYFEDEESDTTSEGTLASSSKFELYTPDIKLTEEDEIPSPEGWTVEEDEEEVKQDDLPEPVFDDVVEEVEEDFPEELRDLDTKEEIKAMFPLPILLEGPVGCVDMDTEYLTRNGWKKINKYNGEEICIWHEDGSTKFEKPVDYIKEEAKELIHLKTTTLDMMLSLGHRTPYITSKGNNGVKPFSELISKNEFKVPRYFSIPSNINSVSISDELIRVLIMQSCDGHYKNNKTMFINVKKDRKKKGVIELLEKANIKYSIHKSSDDYLRVMYTPPKCIATKDISILWQVNKHQAEVVYNEYINWDGSIRGHSISGIKSNIDVYQYIASIVKETYTNIGFESKGKYGDIYRTVSSNRKVSSFSKKEKNILKAVDTKDGYEYCFTTSSTFWLARRNGKIFPTGNTGKTTIFIELAKELDLKYYANVLTDQTPASEFKGYKNVMNGDYVRTEFREAFEHGGLYVLEEINAATSNMPIIFNTVENGYFVFADKIVDAHPDFRLCATMNNITNPKDFAGRRPLDKSVRNRFHCMMILGDFESRFSKKSLGIMKQINSWSTENGYDLEVTPRDITRYEKLISSSDISQQLAIDKALLKGYRASDKQYKQFLEEPEWEVKK